MAGRGGEDWVGGGSEVSSEREGKWAAGRLDDGKLIWVRLIVYLKKRLFAHIYPAKKNIYSENICIQLRV